MVIVWVPGSVPGGSLTSYQSATESRQASIENGLVSWVGYCKLWVRVLSFYLVSPCPFAYYLSLFYIAMKIPVSQSKKRRFHQFRSCGRPTEWVMDSMIRFRSSDSEAWAGRCEQGSQVRLVVLCDEEVERWLRPACQPGSSFSILLEILLQSSHCVFVFRIVSQLLLQ